MMPSFPKPLNALAAFGNKFIEKSGIDGIVNGAGKTVQWGSRQLRLLQSGQVGTYVLWMVLGILLFFVVTIFL
jgi:NADH-quinone oxidoreductase subunit L